MKFKVGDRVYVYGPCTQVDWHNGEKHYEITEVQSDGSVRILVGNHTLSGFLDECEVHERQCELKKSPKKTKLKKKK